MDFNFTIFSTGMIFFVSKFASQKLFFASGERLKCPTWNLIHVKIDPLTYGNFYFQRMTWDSERRWRWFL